MASNPAQAAPDAARGPAEPGVEALVEAERTRALFERNAVAQATVFLNSAIAVGVLWGHAPPARLLAWAGAVWLVALGRLALGASFRRSARLPGEAARWARIFTAGAGANGLCWGAAPVLVGDGLPLAHLVFLAFLLGGMAAGAALSNASRQSAFLAFTVPALAPMLALLLSGGDRLRLGMGLLLLVFGLAVSAISRAGGRMLAEAVRLRFANAELARGLGVLNRELEARVAERSSQLEAAWQRERETEHQLATSTRLALVGTLAAGLAHEINNPLTYVRSNLGYVREELARLGVQDPARAELEEALAEASEGVERVRLIVRRLMSLARIDAREEPTSLDLHAVLDACVAMVRPEAEHRARVVTDFGRVPAVLGGRIRLVQVFLNLLHNAFEAIREGEPARHEVRVATRADPGGEVVIVEVSDTGCGIPEEDLGRIWDPFFTTKPLHQHMGLGLSICRNLLATLGGAVDATSRPGAGSTFTVRLPAAEAARPEESLSAAGRGTR